MDEPTRRAWSKPELIVLVRSGPAEAVLQACRSDGESGDSATNAGECTCNPEAQCSPCGFAGRS